MASRCTSIPNFITISQVVFPKKFVKWMKFDKICYCVNRVWKCRVLHVLQCGKSLLKSSVFGGFSYFFQHSLSFLFHIIILLRFEQLLEYLISENLKKYKTCYQNCYKKICFSYDKVAKKHVKFKILVVCRFQIEK